MVILGYCGDRCDVCPRYIASQKKGIDELKKVVILWKKAGFRNDIDNPNNLICDGCNKEKECAYDNIKQCCISKNIENCGNCRDYPCILVIKAFEKTRDIEIKCSEILNPDDFKSLKTAFFQKKKYLDDENKKKF
ncbi:MAG: DUF3795 domain-containing protein [Candidatus Lokiarchaeota archaeon]|nr:DUF3795 domain-containing protein [Candidatus Lokiarchaeota archaeon]